MRYCNTAGDGMRCVGIEEECGGEMKTKRALAGRSRRGRIKGRKALRHNITELGRKEGMNA